MSVNRTRKIVSVAGVTAIAASATLSFGGAVAGAAAVADFSAKQMREVCAKSVYVKERPGVIPVGSVVKGQRVQVTRFSKSGRYAHIVARQGNYTTRGWVPTRYLCAKGAHA